MKLAALFAAKPLADLHEQVWDKGRDHMLCRYQPGDEAHLDLRDDFAAAWDLSGRVLPAGLRWTLHGLEGPLAVGGLEPLDRPGVYGAWGLASDLNPRAWAFVRLAAGKILACAERELAAREIQAMAAPIPGAVRLLARLGFAPIAQCEGPDGRTYTHMARRF